MDLTIYTFTHANSWSALQVTDLVQSELSACYRSFTIVRVFKILRVYCCWNKVFSKIVGRNMQSIFRYGQKCHVKWQVNAKTNVRVTSQVKSWQNFKIYDNESNASHCCSRWVKLQVSCFCWLVMTRVILSPAHLSPPFRWRPRKVTNILCIRSYTSIYLYLYLFIYLYISILMMFN